MGRGGALCSSRCGLCVVCASAGAYFTEQENKVVEGIEVENGSLSIVHGSPLEDEPGQGIHTIGGYLRELAKRFGPSEAVVLRSGDYRLSWSYDDLLARAMEVAKSLIACGAGKDTRVGILMTNRPEFLSALFGTALAGGVPVPLSTFSTQGELDYLVKASQVSLLLYEAQVLKKDFHAMLAEVEPGIAGSTPGALVSETVPFLRHLVSLGGITGAEEPLQAPTGGAVESWEAFLARGSDIPDEVVCARADSVHPTDTGGIFFSSGTTSLPKGIIHSQRAFAIQWWRWPRVFAMREPVRSWTGNGFFWSGNCSMVLGSAFSTGGTVVLQRYFDAEEALELMDKERLAFINGRPHQWARLQTASNWNTVDLSSVKYVPRGEMIWQHPTVDTDWEVPMSFGTTETMTICTSFTADVEKEKYEGSFGAPLPGNTLKIVDPLTGSIMPLGEKGEMCIKGPTLMSGYLGKSPEECFDADGFFCTGDGGHVDAEGRFFWDGRLTDMIKTGGANVAPVEVDDVIAKFPGVKRTQTVGVPDDLLGEMVVACIVPVDGATLAGDEIIAYVKQEIASFKVPRKVLFFTDEEYAITGSEKVKSSVVRELAIKRLETA
ncbi:MAG: acyl--CoA ligase [Novosphingobium sp.]|nr:acyl--CoA ligase [Novosphingobium sp.]